MVGRQYAPTLAGLGLFDGVLLNRGRFLAHHRLVGDHERGSAHAPGVGLRVRGTRYQTPGHGPGLLVTGGVRFSPPAIGSLEFNGGTRRETADPDRDRYWAGFDIQLYLHRSWFALATFTREWGRAGLTPTTDLLYGGLSYRF